MSPPLAIAGRVEILADAKALAARAADLIAQRLADCREPFRMVLSGGSTPRETYRRLAGMNAPRWACTEIFFSDERFVAPESADSNYRMARETLLEKIQ